MKPENNGQNESRCICSSCRVKTSCHSDRSEVLFCARAKSDGALNTSQTCICAMCPVYNDNDLSGSYFCAKE